MPTGRTLAGGTPGGSQHLATADRAVVEETADGKCLVAIFRLGVDAGRGLPAHCLQQTRANTAQTRIAKPAEIFLNHANYPQTNAHGQGITAPLGVKVDSQLRDHRSQRDQVRR